jgi:HSP20 family protein
MAIERWRPRRDVSPSPFRGLARSERDFGSLFDRFFSDWPSERWELGTQLAPSVDIVERDDEVILRADVPGLSEKDIDVSYNEGVVTIRGERSEEKEEKKEDNYYRCERWSGSFSRSLMLPPGVDPERSSARFSNGVLEIHFPKMKGAGARKIEIKAA